MRWRQGCRRTSGRLDFPALVRAFKMELRGGLLPVAVREEPGVSSYVDAEMGGVCRWVRQVRMFFGP